MAESADDIAVERSLIEDISTLVEDGKMLAEAEIDFHKKRALYAANEAKGITALFVAAAVCGFFAAMALVVGLVLALGQIITYWGSTALVTAVLGIIALLLAKKGTAKINRMKAVIAADEEGRNA
ncbi:phage holin family protein [Croceicoccus mobilis]|uniref:Phage holin family protein n=1 Tax=Croceicoccus mobilis TaxID=1703339 RepID=A0A916YXI6_9SPHN|nr:phage holin family protein [Croceicoccus mobilis]GGD66605.1 hypothetical protein GCM10010990_15190 [Croceicoccus mobilis]